MEHEDLIVSMKGIQKSFGGVHALTDGELTLRKGEVLGLMNCARNGSRAPLPSPATMLLLKTAKKILL